MLHVAIMAEHKGPRISVNCELDVIPRIDILCCYRQILNVSQSAAYQLAHNLESQKLQYAMEKHFHQFGWREIK